MPDAPAAKGGARAAESAVAKEIRALRDVFRGPDLRRLELAWLATSVAVWGSALALAVHAYAIGGATAVGVMALFRTLPGALSAPFLAWLADRRSRRSVLFATNALRAGVLAGIAGAVAVDAGLATLYALVALLAIVGPLYRPSQSALLPVLARTPGELSSANVATSMLVNLGFVAGSLAVGALLTVISPATVLAALAGVFVLSLVPLAGIRRDPPRLGPARAGRAEALDGFRTIANDRQLRELTVMTGGLSVVEGAIDVLMVAAALGFLGLGEAGAGYLWAAWGVGAIGGGAAAVGLLSRGALTVGLTLGSLVSGIAIALVGVIPPEVAVAALAGAGGGYSVVDVAANTLLQRLTADHVIARVFGVIEGLYVASVAVGSACAGLLVDAVGPRWALAIVGAVMPIVVLARRSRLSGLEAGAPVPAREYALLRAHPIFAPLPVASTERLARRLTETRPPEGGAVIVQGDVGEHFYLVAEGELDVFEDGEWRRTMGAGDGFGEIALLRDVPRTATVRARSGVVCLRLDRVAFIETVTGQPYSRRAADALVEERLGSGG